MDTVFSSAHLFWWEKLLIVVVTSLVILIPIYLIPKKKLARIGARPCLSPNWITTHRIWIAYLGYLLYFFFSFFEGLCLIALGYALDALDGMVSRAMGDRNPDRKGVGKWYDPLADKLAVLPFMIAMWYRGHLYVWLLILLLVTEVAGTLIRKPFSEGPWLRATGAKNVGKAKFLSQVLCLVATLPFDQHWIAGRSSVPNWLLGLSLVMAALSLLSRVRIHPKFDSGMDAINRLLDSSIRFFQRGGLRRLVSGW